MEHGLTDAAANHSEELWPSFRANVDRARTLSQANRQTEPEQPSVFDELSRVDKELHRQRIQILSLEAALADAGAETESLSKYLALCFEVMESQDERLSEGQSALKEQIADLAERSNRQERDMLELRSSQNAKAERMEIASAELLELTHATRVLAERALDNSALSSEENEVLAERVAEVDAEIREAAENLAREMREMREAHEEIRVTAEKAKDLAEFSSDTVAGLQADLEERSEATDDPDRSNDGDRATLSQLEASAAALRRELARELNSLRRSLEREGDEPSAPTAKQRFRYYLPETQAPVAEPRALNVAIESATTVEEA